MVIMKEELRGKLLRLLIRVMHELSNSVQKRAIPNTDKRILWFSNHTNLKS